MMHTTHKKRCSVLFAVIIAALFVLTGVILLLPYKAATAEDGDTVEAVTVKFGNSVTEYNSIAEAWTYANGLTTTENIPAVITMQSDAVTTDTLTVAAGKYITLDLNGRILKYNNRSAQNSVITVLGNLTLKDSNPQVAHRYYRDSDNYGLWVFDEVNGTETLKGGVITGGTGNDYFGDDVAYGGGVCVGSIYDDDDNLIYCGTFTMESGAIAGNMAPEGGGVFVHCGEFTMTGGAISGNMADADGTGSSGGVFVDCGEFTMVDGIISDNYTGGIGGGVVVFSDWIDEDNIIDGTFTMSGGEIIGNRAGVFVGGVCVMNDGTFVMTDGTISGNTGTYGVGGVGIFVGSFKMSGGTISGNMQTDDMGLGYFGGVCVGHPMLSEFDAPITFEVSGAPIITGNKVTVNGNTVENNVVLSEGYTAKVVGALEADGIKAQIGVHDTGVALTSDYSVYNKDGNDDIILATTYFIPDQPGYVPIVYGGEVRLDEGVATVTVDGEETVYGSIETAWAAANGAQSAASVKMYDDAVITDTLNVNYGKNITLDLNGRMLKYDNSEAEKSVINVIGTFTLKDDGDKTIRHTITSAVNNEDVIVYGGVITGGCSISNGGGGVYVNGGTFTMLGGSISGNQSDGSGGGVYVQIFSTFNMYGGTISENYTTAGHYGGGVSSADGTFNMYGGVICKNKGTIGGGVYVSGTVTISGGTISENVANTRGGGVYVGGGTFNVSGAPNITGNTDADGGTNNVYLSGKTITVAGELTAGAQISVHNNSVVVTSGYGANNKDENNNIVAPSYFIADSEGYVPVLDGGEVKLVAGVATVTFDGNGTAYSNIVDAWDYANGLATAAAMPAKVTMFADITITDNLSVSSGKYITLDLNGHILKFTPAYEGAANRPVVWVHGNFTLVDSNTQAEHSYYVNGDGLWVFVGDDYENDGTQMLKAFRGGVITGGMGNTVTVDTYRSNGGGVFVDNGATFTMKGGAVAGNTADYGGGVGIYDGTFIMENGIICGNKIALDGGGVCVKGRYNGGSFTLKNGTISNNIGSGVVAVALDSEFNMIGGTICDNTVTGGGGGLAVSGGAVVNMSDGTICNNTASGNGGGVMVGSGGTFNVSGTPIITGNYGANGVNDNVSVYYHWSESLRTKITVSGNLDIGAQIGVHIGSTGYVITGFTQNDDPSAYFIPDDITYDCLSVIDDDGTVYITMHNFWGEETVITDPTCTEAGVKIIACLNDPSHTTTASIPAIGHSWEEELSFDETYHWNDCANDCGETQNEQPHTFVNGVCECGFVKPADVAQVTFNGANTAYVTVEGAFAYANSLETTENAPAVITLLDNATTTDTLTVAAGKYIILDLDGYMLKYDNDTTKNSVITVNGTFTLKDSNAQAEHRYYIADESRVWIFVEDDYEDDGTYELNKLNGGVITGGTGYDAPDADNDAFYGGGVYVAGGTFTMESGSISGNSSADGGGMCVDGGTFTMTGGKICGNVAYEAGGGVFVDNYSTFTIKSGTISDNYANMFGGGVMISDSSVTLENGSINTNMAQAGGGLMLLFGTFKMTGGTVCYNGGTVFAGGVGVQSGTFIMENGSICKNTGFGGAGGVLLLDGTFKMSGGTISGNEQTQDIGFGLCAGVVIGDPISDGVEAVFEISGAPVITENRIVSNDTDLNTYFFDDNATITVTGALTEGAKIGIYNNGVIATGFKQDGNPSDYFVSDDPTYNCVYVSDEPSGTVTIGEHDYSNEWTADKNSHWHACTHCGDKKDEVAHVNGDAATCTAAQICTVCEYQIEAALSHDFTGEYLTDKDGHWHVCSREGCDVTDTKENHNAVKDNAVAATCTASGKTEGSHCSTCGAILKAQTTVAALGHTLSHHPEVPATEAVDGNIEYWECEECEKIFADEDGKTEIIDKSSIVIPKLEVSGDGNDIDALWITLIVVLSTIILFEIWLIISRKTHYRRKGDK